MQDKYRRSNRSTQVIQEGLGSTLIDGVIKHIIEQQLKACVVKRTPSVLVLQFNRSDKRGVQILTDFIYAHQLQFKLVEEESLCRINMFIDEKRICTISIDMGGITAFEIEPRTGLMVRPDNMGSYSLPTLVVPSADFVDSYREAAREYAALNMVGVTPPPDDDDYWQTTVLTDIERKREGVELYSGEHKTQTYWLIHDDTYVGSILLRNRITPELWDDYGCNTFFEIRPSKWRQGYGRVMLQLAWSKALLAGLDFVCIGVETDNIAATRLVKSSGAIPIATEDWGTRYIAPAFLLVNEETDYSRFM